VREHLSIAFCVVYLVSNKLNMCTFHINNLGDLENKSEEFRVGSLVKRKCKLNANNNIIYKK
jgi:hypothetical protein